MSDVLADNTTKLLRGAGRHWGWPPAYGIITLLLGVMVLVWPGISLLTLAVVLGVWLLVLGIMEIVFAFQLRSAGRTVGQMTSAT